MAEVDMQQKCIGTIYQTLVNYIFYITINYTK